MAYDGSLAVTRLGSEAIKIVADTLDADSEETYALFPVDSEDLSFVPLHASLISTHANNITYDLALQGSDNGVTWEDILSNTAKDTIAKTTVDYTSATGNPTPAAFPHYRILLVDNTTSTTPGAGGHTATVHLWR